MALRPQRPQNRSDQLKEREAAQQDVFVREVDDALREDELFGALRRWGKPLGIAVVLGLLGLGGYLWWDHSREQAVGAQGETMVLALDRLEANRLDEADSQLDSLVKDGDPGPRAAAMMMRASIAAQKGRRDEAARQFASVAADAAAPQPLRDLASVREMAIKFDTVQPQQVVDRLKPLAVPGNAWFGSAGELVGLAYMKQGRNDLAGPLFAAIAKNKDVPASLRDRARTMAGMLGVDAIEDPAKDSVRQTSAAR